MPSHHITMSDQELQLLEQVRIRMGLATIEQTVETLARSALSCGRQPGNDGPQGQHPGLGEARS